jgi:hypothetical protein
VAVIVNTVAMGQGEPAVWVYLLALLPLASLLFTGLYLFVLPYATKWQQRATHRLNGGKEEELQRS